MTDTTAAQEPTMEEILASIRRIISEDDAPAETGAAAEPEAAPAAEVSPALMDETPSMQEPEAAEEDVLELTEAYEAPTVESIGDLDVSVAEEPEPFPSAPASESAFAEPVPASSPNHPAAPASSYDPLVGDSAAASAASAFAGFATAVKKPEPADIHFPSGPTIDEMVRGLLRPMLKEWLDANLPAIVETQVRKEVERIARTAG
jgi:cell pole-organizing protein PopZ